MSPNTRIEKMKKYETEKLNNIRWLKLRLNLEPKNYETKTIISPFLQDLVVNEFPKKNNTDF